MNGYTMMADSYRKLMSEGKIDKDTGPMSRFSTN